MFEEHYHIVFYSMLLGSVLLMRIPYVGNFIQVVYTLFHESAHSLIALFVSGKIYKTELHPNSEGMALIANRYAFNRFLVGFAGYPVAAVFSLLCFLLIENNQHEQVLFIALFFALGNLILFTRNTFGIIWLIIFSTAIGVCLYFNNETIIWYFALELAIILFIESIRQSIIIFRISLKHPKDAGDASVLKLITYIPSWFWGLVFALSSSLIALLTILNYFPLLNSLKPLSL